MSLRIAHHWRTYLRPQLPRTAPDLLRSDLGRCVRMSTQLSTDTYSRHFTRSPHHDDGNRISEGALLRRNGRGQGRAHPVSMSVWISARRWAGLKRRDRGLRVARWRPASSTGAPTWADDVPLQEGAHGPGTPPQARGLVLSGF